VDRIAIIGCGGSGKSRLARELGKALGITPAHLDGLYYDQDWRPLDKDQFAGLQRDLVAAQRWILDGNYASSLPIRLEAADTIIFLDLPARTCLRGIGQRRLRHGGGQHASFGVYDRITWSFIRYIASYRKQMTPRVHNLIAAHAGDAQVIVFRSRRAVRRYTAGAAIKCRPEPVTDPAIGQLLRWRHPNRACITALHRARVCGRHIRRRPEALNAAGPADPGGRRTQLARCGGRLVAQQRRAGTSRRLSPQTPGWALRHHQLL
jgi:adenylate kinase family enzyme